MSRFYLFLNGINTKLGDYHGWHYRAERWVDNNTDDKADTYAYEVRTLTRWLEQPRLIQEVGEIISQNLPPWRKLVLCGHSNGCAVAAGVLGKFPSLKVEELHLIAAAVDDSYEKNGLNAAVARGQVGRIVLYCSKDDSALKWAKWTHWVNYLNSRWGYGYLGLEGPTGMTPEAEAITTVIPHEGYDHDTYFAPEHFEDTMRAVTGLIN